MRSPAAAIAWEIWNRHRFGMLALVTLLLSVSVFHALFIGQNQDSGLAPTLGYLLLVLCLFVTFGFFHFTEGQKRGGFGSYPRRLFNLPVATHWLVALPMLYGLVSVLAVYLIGSWLIFAPLGLHQPVLWPCLYIASSFVMFQTIIWSFPDQRYVKLLCLSAVAAVITFAWMFFLPHVIAGTLEEWGYAGSPQTFLRYLSLGLVLSVPLAYGVSAYRIQQQRHGRTSSGQWLLVIKDRWLDLFARSRSPYTSVNQAIFWHEWRQTGLILTIAVSVVLAMTCLPAYLSRPLSANATTVLVSWLLIAPVALSMIIGRGFAKPDFWNPSLDIAPFMAVRPVSAGQWVMNKLKVALASVLVTWGVTLLVLFLMVAHAGDLGGLDRLYQQSKFYYAPWERVILAILLLFGLLLLSWRFLVSGLTVGLSGRKRWYFTANLLTSAVGIGLLALILWRSDNDQHNLHLYNLWRKILWLPWIAGVLVLAKTLLAVWAWNRVIQEHLLPRKTVQSYFLIWLLATIPLLTLVQIAFTHTLWLKYLLMLIALLWMPLASPATATLTLAANRRR